jgi:hypothetical protein
MRLTDLEPRWIHVNVLAFRCPCCRELWLTAKNAPMGRAAQRTLFSRTFGSDWEKHVVLSSPMVAWQIAGFDFKTLTITPSIDASQGGHWNGTIRMGEIVTLGAKRPLEVHP